MCRLATDANLAITGHNLEDMGQGRFAPETSREYTGNSSEEVVVVADAIEELEAVGCITDP
jgi:hypothetical protein